MTKKQTLYLMLLFVVILNHKIFYLISCVSQFIHVFPVKLWFLIQNVIFDLWSFII